MVTPLGWGLVLSTIAAGVGLALLGWAELLVFFLAGLTLVAAGLVMSAGNLSCKAELDLDRIRLSAGQESELSIILSNPGHGATRRGRVSILVGSESVYLPVPALSPGQLVHLHLGLQAMHRGAMPVGPITMEAGDPFGIIRRQQVLADGGQLYVHPKVVSLLPVMAGLERDLEGQASPGIVDDDLEFHALRPYEPGDDIKRIHWLSTARTGSMMVRQYEPALRTDTALWMDTNPSSYASADEFEMAVSIFASLGAQCLLDGRRLAAVASSSRAGHNPSSHVDLRPQKSRSNGPDGPSGGRSRRMRQSRSTRATDLLRTDTADAFLDDCSAILPAQTPEEEDGDQPPSSRSDTMKSQGSSTSLLLLVTGSRTGQQAIEAMASGLPRSIRSMALTASQGQQRTIRYQGGLAWARLNNLEDLPLIMKALS